MAATVVSRSTGRTTTTNTTSHAITMPASMAAGNLLLLTFSVDGTPTCTAPSDWTKLGQASNSTVVTGAIFWKYAEGSGDTCTITTSASEQSSHAVIQISGASTPTGTSANGSSTNSNPPSHNSGETSTLWIATRSGDSTVVATVAPTNYGNLQSQAAAGTGGASTNTADRTTSATSEDPGTFTSNTEQWVSWTIGIPDQPANKPFITGYNLDDTANASGKTFSVYIPFDNSTLIVGLTGYDSTNELDPRISSITYNGNAMTQLQKKEDNNGAGGAAGYLYVLTGLSAGTHDLVITLAGATNSPNFIYTVVANAATSIDASDLDIDSSSGATVVGNITTVADLCLVWSFVGLGNFSGTATGSDQQTIASSSSGLVIVSNSRTVITPAATTVTHTYTSSVSDTGDVYIISIKPYAAAGVTFIYPTQRMRRGMGA